MNSNPQEFQIRPLWLFPPLFKNSLYKCRLYKINLFEGKIVIEPLAPNKLLLSMQLCVFFFFLKKKKTRKKGKNNKTQPRDQLTLQVLCLWEWEGGGGTALKCICFCFVAFKNLFCLLDLHTRIEKKVESDDWVNVKWLQWNVFFKKNLKISFKSWIIKMGGNFPLGSLKGKKKF